MTKIEAIRKVLEDNNGSATLGTIYNSIEKYYPGAKSSCEWEAGIRGIIYRDLKEKDGLKRIGLGIFALKDYKEEHIHREDKIRMHSYMEGLCLEIGNLKKYKTYTADPSAVFKDNVLLGDLSYFQKIPQFTYPNILDKAGRIDVIWFGGKSDNVFPAVALEVVDSLGTLEGALNRCLQLDGFNTIYRIISPEKHRARFDSVINANPYRDKRDKFMFIDYDEMKRLYDCIFEYNGLDRKFF